MTALRARVLGPFVLEGIDLRSLRSRKARTTLKLLALGRGRPVSLDRLIDGLWPDGDEPPQPERELSVNISRARRLVGRERIERSDAGYRLDLDWLDLDRLDDLLVEGRRRAALGDHVATRNLASAGLALVTGPLLADEPDAAWLIPDRVAVDRTVAELRGLAATAALGVGEWGEAAHWAELALADDPYDEAAARALMAARLGAGRPGSALATYAQVRHRLVEDLGAGPAPETEALHLVALDASADTSTAPRRGPPADDAAGVGATLGPEPASVPHVPGRDDAVRQLEEAARRVMATGALELVEVEGEAGAGKSHLLDAFATSMTRAGGVVLLGRCDELGRALPLQPVADALASYLHAGGHAAQEVLLAEDADLLGAVLGLSGSPPLPALPGPGMSGDAMQSLVFGALLRAVARVARVRPTVLMIDDLHLAGPSTTAWLMFLARRHLEIPLLVVGARRPEGGAVLAGATSVALAPLDLAAAGEIVGPERARLVWERSGGNALLLIELAAHDAATLPASIRESVAAQVEATGPDVAATIRTAAVLGPEIDLDLLAEVSGRSPLELLDHLEQATARQLLVERGSRFEFRHALVREAVVAGTSSTRQALVHRQAVRVLQSRPGTPPLELARQARLAGDRATAAGALADAARLATGRHDLVEADRLLSDALDLDDRAELRLQRGHLRVARSEFEAGEADAEAAAALGRHAESLALRAWIARHRHDLRTAVRLGQQGAALATDPTTRASCLVAVALAERGLGALPVAEARLAEAAAAGSPTDLGLPGWLGVLRVHQGRVDEALDLLEPAVGSEIDTVHGFWVEHVLQMSAHAHALQGRPVRALALIDRYRREMVARGSETRYRGGDDNYRAWILDNLGQPEAADLTARAVEVAAMPEISAQARLDEAARRLTEGDLAGAADSLARAEAIWSQTDFYNQWRCQVRATLIHGRLHLAAGQAVEALDLAQHAHRDSLARGERRYTLLSALLAARARHRLGGATAPDLDLDQVDHDLRVLGQVAGLEAWWMTAELAAEMDQPRWWRLAEQRVTDLGSQAGERSDSFVAHASRRLDRLRLTPPGR